MKINNYVGAFLLIASFAAGTYVCHMHYSKEIAQLNKEHTKQLNESLNEQAKKWAFSDKIQHEANEQRRAKEKEIDNEKKETIKYIYKESNNSPSCVAPSNVVDRLQKAIDKANQ